MQIVLQSSGLVQPGNTEVAAYSHEEYLSTPEAAGTQLHASMPQRQKTIDIFYQVSADQTIPVYDIMDHALIHTKNPVEGDYLWWNMGGYVATIHDYKKIIYSI